jgi:hypothetical protein
VQELPEVVPVLLRERLVETEPLPELL